MKSGRRDDSIKSSSVVVNSYKTDNLRKEIQI